MNPSALDSSISTLEKAISSLEALSESLDFWLKFWTAIVAVGVALEIFVVIREHVTAHQAWRRGTIRTPEKPSIWFFVLQLAGPVLITAGIVGELWVSVLSGRTNSELRIKNKDLVALVNQKAGFATIKAQDAKTSADKAADAARRAETSAKFANHQAEVAKGRANQIAERAERLGWLMNAWAKRINFRSLDTKRFVSLMKEKPKGTAEIWYVPDDDDEPEMFAYEIQRALGTNGVGWAVPEVRPLLVLADSKLEPGRRRTVLEELRLSAKGGLAVAAQEANEPTSDNLFNAFVDALGQSISSGIILVRGAEYPTLPRNHLIVVVGHRRVTVPAPDFLRSKP